MAHNVYTTDGNLLTTVNDGTINNVTSLGLVGIGYIAYSEVISEDLVRLMENFSNSTPPLSPIVGQLWWNKAASKLSIYDGNTFKPINNITWSATSPTSNINGDFWYDSTNEQLKFYNEGAWTLISPAYTKNQRKSGQIVETIVDTGLIGHTVTTEYNASNLVAIISSDTFSIQNITGLTDIRPGINLVEGYELTGIASLAREAKGLRPAAASTFMLANATATTVGNLYSYNQEFGIANSAYFNVYPEISEFAISTKVDYASLEYKSVFIDKINSRVGINNRTPQWTLDINGSVGLNGDIWATSNAGHGIYWDNIVDTRIVHDQGILFLIHGNASVFLDSNDGVTISDLTVSNSTVLHGATNTGNIVNPTLPTVNSHLANKQYVDQQIANNNLPVGCVIMWYGDYLQVPVGWQICDGTNGTPDLREKFVFGAGVTTNVADTGGSNDLTVTTTSSGGHFHTGNTTTSGAHQHSFTVNTVPAHTHDFYDVYGYMDDVDNVTIGNFNFVNGVPTYYPYNPASNIGVSTSALTNRPNSYPKTFFVDADNKPVQPVLYNNGGRALNGYEFFFQNLEGGVGPNLSVSGIDHVQFAFKNRTLSTGTETVNANTSTDGNHYHNISTNTEPPHTHSVSFDNRPSWVALYYIMRVG